VDSDLLNPINLNPINLNPINQSERNEQYNLSSNQNSSIFVTLGKISEQERVEIIKKGFQINQPLKKYSEEISSESDIFLEKTKSKIAAYKSLMSKSIRS
jgi:hypothetical protein